VVRHVDLVGERTVVGEHGRPVGEGGEPLERLGVAAVDELLVEAIGETRRYDP
jgi:hypothetical protein